MKILKYYALLLLMLVSCKPKLQDTQFIESRKFKIELLEASIKCDIHNDRSELLKIYKRLNKHKEFKGSFFEYSQVNLLMDMYIYLEKYKELDKIFLMHKSSLSKDQIFVYNINKFLLKGKNHPEFIYDNMNELKKMIARDKNDSLIYVDYFVHKVYLQGKEKTLQDIDSMKKKNKKISAFFYKYVLKQTIEEYPDALLPVYYRKKIDVPILENPTSKNFDDLITPNNANLESGSIE